MKLGFYIRSLRPAQWLKNLMLFFPPFLAGAIFHPRLYARGAAAFAVFCCASSAVYTFNDLLDRKNDQRHPQKRLRPIASGDIPVLNAIILSAVLAAVAIDSAISFFSFRFVLLVCAYVVISAGYSLALKNHALIDLFCIAAGFVIRLEAGGEASGVVISDWLFLTVFLLAIFLSTGKRLGEQASLGVDAPLHRNSLAAYPPGFLDGCMFMTGAAVLVTYSMYVITRPFLICTVPLCTFGLMRFALRVKSGGNGDPTDSLLKDPTLFVVGMLWALVVGWGIYGR